MATVLLLNGISSSGKTSIAKALQTCMPEPWLHVSMDKFIGMLHPRFIGPEPEAEPGFFFARTKDAAGELYTIRVGETGKKLMVGMRQLVKILADMGNPLILDDVIYGTRGFLEYAELLSAHKVYLIAVSCRLDIAESRERARGDRVVPHTRGQFPVVNRHPYFDINVDTSDQTPIALAEKIYSYILENNQPTALKELERHGHAKES